MLTFIVLQIDIQKRIIYNNERGVIMAKTKTANVNCRISEDIKCKAEDILTKMGLPRSVAIDMFYRQIIMNNGLPFPVTIPEKPFVRENMTDEEFDAMMTRGIKEANSTDLYDVDKVFDELT